LQSSEISPVVGKKGLDIRPLMRISPAAKISATSPRRSAGVILEGEEMSIMGVRGGD
jgi:hypothetical protein